MYFRTEVMKLFKMPLSLILSHHGDDDGLGYGGFRGLIAEARTDFYQNLSWRLSSSSIINSHPNPRKSVKASWFFETSVRRHTELYILSLSQRYSGARRNATTIDFNRLLGSPSNGPLILQKEQVPCISSPTFQIDIKTGLDMHLAMRDIELYLHVRIIR